MEAIKISPEGNREELYGLLSLAELKFGQAIQAAATTWTSLDDEGAVAGRVIFKNTLDKVIKYKNKAAGDEDSLSRLFHIPELTDYPKDPSDAEVLPPPVLCALGFCFHYSEAICLKHLGLTCGRSMYDQLVIPWPYVLLRGLNTKSHFLRDMIDVFSDTSGDSSSPLLSDPQVRAIQLLVIARSILHSEIKKIGRPSLSRVLRPS